jgi:uncharacterized protein YceK
MKRRSNVCIILIVFLLFVQQIISGCATTVTKDLYKKELHKEEVDLVSQKLYQNKCSLCHELPDIDAYPYTPEQWAGIIDFMHDTKAARKFITIEETEKIKVYLGRLSQTR